MTSKVIKAYICFAYGNPDQQLFLMAVLYGFRVIFRCLKICGFQSPPDLPKLGVNIWPIASSAETLQLSACLTICWINSGKPISNGNNTYCLRNQYKYSQIAAEVRTFLFSLWTRYLIHRLYSHQCKWEASMEALDRSCRPEKVALC